MGAFIPKMGILKLMVMEHGGVIGDALFSSTQRRVLGLIFGHPDRSFFTTEVVEKVKAGTGAVQRELKKLEQSGLVTVKRVGSQKHYQANSDSPVYHELRGLVVKTVGIVGPLEKSLRSLNPVPALALIYGSVAKDEFAASSDVDLLVVSDDLTLEALLAAFAPAEEQLGRRINPTLYTAAEYRERKEQGAHFLTSVLRGPTIVLLGDVDLE